MNICQQCYNWDKTGQYQKIVDAIEAIPDEKRYLEMDIGLARAYINLADPEEPEGKKLLKKALDVLKPYEEYCSDNFFWNFVIGLTYYYLQQEGTALHYFEKALEIIPGDEDTTKMINSCKDSLRLPLFYECFRERTEKAWNLFSQREAELRQIFDESKNNQQSENPLDLCNEILNLAFDHVSFALGFNGQKYTLVLSPDGDKVDIFKLIYFRECAPQNVLKNWEILIGRQQTKNANLVFKDGFKITAEEVQVWIEQQEENSISLFVYCEKLLPLLEEESPIGWWRLMLIHLTEFVLGELSCMKYINTFDVLSIPRSEPSFTMNHLPDKLRELNMDSPISLQNYLKTYMSYEAEPDEDPYADWRMDVIVGHTHCPPLLNEYLNNNNKSIDDLHIDGAIAGFLAYPIIWHEEENNVDKFFEFREQLEKALTTEEASKYLTIIGKASGKYYGYVDFIAWDSLAALELASDFFKKSPIPWACFHSFRRDVGDIILKKVNEETLEDQHSDDNSYE